VGTCIRIEGKFLILIPHLNAVQSNWKTRWLESRVNLAGRMKRRVRKRVHLSTWVETHEGKTQRCRKRDLEETASWGQTGTKLGHTWGRQQFPRGGQMVTKAKVQGSTWKAWVHKATQRLHVGAGNKGDKHREP